MMYNKFKSNQIKSRNEKFHFYDDDNDIMLTKSIKNIIVKY